MLAEFLQSSEPGVTARWKETLPGVRVCRFTVEQPEEGYPFTLPLHRESRRQEALFCMGGTLLLQRRSGLLSVGEREILLLSDRTELQQIQLTAPFSGLLVSMDSREAGSSLAVLRSLMGDLSLYQERVRSCMEERGGSMVLQSGPWCRTMFAALDAIPQGEQAVYCVMKTAELLYLLCSESPLLEEETESPYPDSYLARTVTEMRAYMESHLEEKLTIEAMSQRFHISPTAFKSCFRRLYGQPVHHWLQVQRMKRAAELLRTTPMAVLQIAQQVGYEGGSQFNLVFKRQYGVTPRQYKKLSETIES